MTTLLRCSCWMLVIFLAGSGTDALAAKLTRSEFNKHSATMGVVLMDVNWGRRWGCGEFDNAQLLKLLFENTSLQPQVESKYNEIAIKTPSKLFVDPVFQSYGFMVTPGTYAFTGWSVKVANSLKEVFTAEVGRDKMVQGDTYLGGTFTVAPGELVYIGNFWVDCGIEPMPWRYFTEWGAEWDDHRQQFASQFKFLQGKDIQRRVLDTEYFGHHPLKWLNNKGNVALAEGKHAEAIILYEQALDQAEASNDPLHAAIAMFNLGRANGLSCNYDLGVSWFDKSIALKKTLPDQEGAYLSQNYLELGRLYASAGDWQNMIANFELGIPILDQLGMVTMDPIGYANILEALRSAYQAVGNDDQAAQLEAKIAEIRLAHPDETAKFVPDNYTEVCTGL